MSSNTNIGNTPVNQGYVQLIHMGETGGIDGTLRALYDGDGTASDLLIASDKVKISTTLYIGSKTLTEFVQDTVGTMFSSNTETNITVTYQDADGTIDLVSSGEVTLTGSETLTNKTLTSPVINTGISGSAILDSDTMSGASATKLSSSESIKAYVDTEVAGIVSSAPSTLDTLNELAAALGDDANFSTTVTNSIATKLPLAGGQMTGNITFSGSQTVDGRDVSADGSKLDGIEASATADQSNAEIRTAVEAATDSNVFTDADHSKLNAIEASADVTDTANVTSAGALMDSEVTDLDGIKSLTVPNDTTISATAKTLLDDANVGAMRNTLGLGTLAIKDNIDDIDQIAAGVKLVAGESFVDSDDNLMTAAAIDDRINSAVSASTYSFTLSDGSNTQPIASGNTLTMTGSTGIDVVVGATDTATLTFDGSELPDMTDAFAGTDEFIVLDGTTSKRKAANEIRLTTFDDTGFSTITIDGTTANGLLTYGGTNNIDTEANLTFDGSTLAVTGAITGSSTLNITGTATLQSYLDFSGTDNRINNTTNDLKIVQYANDKDIIFYNDDGSGGITTYLTLDGSASLVDFSVNSRHIDDKRAFFGNDSDLQIHHNSNNNSYIENNTGNLYIRNYADDSDIVLESDNGSGGTTAYLTLDGSTGHLNLTPPNNVGIGTTHPDTTLDVTAGGANGVVINQDSNDASNSSRMFFKNSSGTYSMYKVGEYLRVNSGATAGGSSGGTNLISIGSNVGIGTASPSAKLHVNGDSYFNGQLYGGFGAVTTGGTADWNHSTNARSGNGYTLLLNSATNGPTTASNATNNSYYHTLNFEYASYDGDANMTQLGIPYSFSTSLYGVRPVIRSRYSGTWSSWNSLITGNSAGQVLGAFGSAAAPSYTFATDVTVDGDTGMFRAGANALGFSTGGTERMRINSSGLIKVGPNGGDTTNVFEIDTSGSTQHGLMINADQARAAGRYALLVDDEDPNSRGSVVIQTASGPSLTTTGNVGIGTASPTTPLHVAGLVQIAESGEAAFYGGNYVRMFGTQSFTFRNSGGSIISQIGLNGNSYFNGGNVGIGTASPLSKLHIEETTNDADALMIRQVAGGSGSVQGKVHIGMNHFNSTYPSVRITAEEYDVADYRGNLAFSTRAATSDAVPTEKMRIMHDGNVGIGTNSPGAKFTVLKDGTQASSVSTTYQIQTVSNSNGGIAIQAGASSTAYLVFGDNGDYDAGRIAYKNASHDLCFYTNNAEEMVLDSDGDLHVDRDVVAYSTTPSDRRLKKNIKEINYGLDTIMNLNPKQYDWKKDDRHDIGFIAQEVEEIIPEIVKDKKHFDKEIKTLDYEKLTAVLIKAVQEQQEQINELKECQCQK